MLKYECLKKAFPKANRGLTFYVYNNAIQGNAHRRCLERAVKLHYSEGPSQAERETERCMPDRSLLPESLQLIEKDEMIITVVVCSTLGHKEQQFDILASQKLYELRDAFHFASDWMFDGPTRLKSASFFIDGIFYDDQRHPGALAYSKEIIEWLRQTRAGFLRKDTPMSMDVRLSDLDSIPFGKRCTYIHQGDVEHGVYFTNARLANPSCDCPLREAYPILTFMRRYSKRLCYACWQNAAVWVVLGSSKCPHNPGFWCGRCFDQFYRDEKGTLVPPHDYKMFPYLHDD